MFYDLTSDSTDDEINNNNNEADKNILILIN